MGRCAQVSGKSHAIWYKKRLVHPWLLVRRRSPGEHSSMGSKRRTHLNPIQVVAFYDSPLVTLCFAVAAFQSTARDQGRVYLLFSHYCGCTVCTDVVVGTYVAHVWMSDNNSIGLFFIFPTCIQVREIKLRPPDLHSKHFYWMNHLTGPRRLYFDSQELVTLCV